MFGLFGNLQKNLISVSSSTDENKSEFSESLKKPLEDFTSNASLLAGLFFKNTI